MESLLGLIAILLSCATMLVNVSGLPSRIAIRAASTSRTLGAAPSSPSCDPGSPSAEDIVALGHGQLSPEGIALFNFSTLALARHEDLLGPSTRRRRASLDDTYAQTVCSDFVATLNAIAPQSTEAVVCPWAYTCDYDKFRYPKFIFQAECTSPDGSCGSCAPLGSFCRAREVNMNVLKADNSCNGNWTPEVAYVSLYCACSTSR